MTHVESFGPKSVSLLGGILAEIEAELIERGQSVSEAVRQEIAHRIMDIASAGETDRNEIKRHALGKSFLDTF